MWPFRRKDASWKQNWPWIDICPKCGAELIDVYKFVEDAEKESPDDPNEEWDHWYCAVCQKCPEVARMVNK